MSNLIKQLKKDLSRLSARFLKEGKEEDFREYEQTRKELIIIEGFEKSKYDIAGDLKLIAEDLKEKYPSIASDALELIEDYSAKTKEKK